MDIVGIVNNQMVLFVICLSLIVITVLLLILVVININQVSKLKRKYNSFMYNTNEETSIEELLYIFIGETRRFASNQLHMENRVEILEKRISGCFQKSGVVRYNPFNDTGGDLSYAIALLDEYNSGFILNGIFNRDGSYTYAKQIVNGAPIKHKLSEEELEALNIALNKK